MAIGLLADPKARNKFVVAVERYNSLLCVISYIVGLTWFLGLAHYQLNGRTYFSENALLPGLVEPDFHHGFGSADFLKDMKAEIKKLKSEANLVNSVRSDVPVEWLHKRFRDIGLDVYAQNYSANVPFTPHGQTQVYIGVNVYAILRAPRSSSTEALVLSSPFRSEPIGGTLGGIALMLGLATAFRRHTYWAKDIIFLITDNEEIGMQAWLSAYHHVHNDYIKADELYGRGGAIQAAINLEISQSSINHMDVKVEGLNGQLPNLDLVNTVVRLCRRENILPTLHQRADYWLSDSWDSYLYSLQTMIAMMWSQASGMPSANHGLFHRYNIEAVTLHGVKLKGSKMHGYPEIGRVIEGIMRSLNNLLERFHQSFFFYLLPSSERYASIGVYLPPFGILCLPIIIKALALWIDFCVNTRDGSTKSSDPADEAQADKKDTEIKSDGDKSKEQEEEEEILRAQADNRSLNNLLSYLPYFLTSIFFGLCAYCGPKFFINTAVAMKLSAAQGIAIGLLAVHMAIVIYPVILRRKLRKSRLSDDKDKPSSKSLGPDARVLKCFALLMLGIVLGATSILNISLAFFVAAASIPFTLTCQPRHNKLTTLLQQFFLLFISPLGLLFISAALDRSFQLSSTVISDKSTSPVSLMDWLTAVWMDVGQHLYTLCFQMELLDNWTYPLVTLVLLPNWVLFTLLVSTETSP